MRLLDVMNLDSENLKKFEDEDDLHHLRSRIYSNCYGSKLNVPLVAHDDMFCLRLETIK